MIIAAIAIVVLSCIVLLETLAIVGGLMETDALDLSVAHYRERADKSWFWLVKANARRKRFERALKKERALRIFLARHNENLLKDINLVLAELRKSEKLARALAADLLNEVVTTEDRATVTKGLTRKL